MLGAHQPIGGRAQLVRTPDHPHHVRFAVGHIHQACIGQLRRLFGDPLVTFHPAFAFFDAGGAAAISGTRFARPHPAIEQAQRLTLKRHRIRRMHIYATPRFIVKRTETVDVLSAEIELGRVLNAQHNLLRRHAFHGARPVRRQDAFPGHFLIGQEAVGRMRLGPVVARLGNAGLRLGRECFHQFSRPVVEAGIAQVQPREFLVSPTLCRLSVAHARRPKDESKCEIGKVYKRACNSLNVNGFPAAFRPPCGDVCNGMGYGATLDVAIQRHAPSPTLITAYRTDKGENPAIGPTTRPASFHNPRARPPAK